MIKRLFPNVISNSSFLFLWLAQITSQIGLNALYFILTIKIYEITKSNTAVSVLILTFTAPSILFGYIAGVYVDQLNLKKVLLMTNILRAFVIFFLILFINQTLLLFVLVLILAIATLFFVPAEGSAIPSLVPDRQLTSANSLFSFSLQLSLILGFLLGGLALKLLGEDTTLFVILLLFLLSIVFNYVLPAKIKSEIKEAKIGILPSFVQGILFIIKTKKVRDSIFFLTLTTTIFFVLATIGPGYVDKILRIDIAYASAVVIAPAVLGMGVGSIFLSHLGDKVRERLLVNIGLFILAFTFLLLALLDSNTSGLSVQIFSLLLIFTLGIGNTFVTIPTTTSFQKNTPEQMRGRAYGLLSTFISGVAALPVLLSGAIGDLFGVRSVIWSLGIIVLGFGIYRLRPKKV